VIPSDLSDESSLADLMEDIGGAKYTRERFREKVGRSKRS